MTQEKRDEISEFLRRAGIGEAGLAELDRVGYFTAPASKGHHLAYEGGLVEHCANVTRRLTALSETLGVEWPRPESSYLVGMLHDLVKCRCYMKEPGGERYEYVQPAYPGHGACSALMAAELGIKLEEKERVAVIFHMGVFGVGKEFTREEFDAAVRAFGDAVIATNAADWYAARIDEEKPADAN